MIGFKDLPDEILLKILCQLDPPDILNLFRIKKLDEIWPSLIVVNADHNLREIEEFGMSNPAGVCIYKKGVDRRLRIPPGVLVTDWVNLRIANPQYSHELKPKLMFLLMNWDRNLGDRITSMIEWFHLNKSTRIMIFLNDHRLKGKKSRKSINSLTGEADLFDTGTSGNKIMMLQLLLLLAPLKKMAKVLSIYYETVLTLNLDTTLISFYADRFQFPNATKGVRDENPTVSQCFSKYEYNQKNKLIAPLFLTPSLKELHVAACYQPFDLNSFNPAESIYFRKGASIAHNGYSFSKVKRLFLQTVNITMSDCFLPVLEELHMTPDDGPRSLRVNKLRAPLLKMLLIQCNHTDVHVHRCDFPKLKYLRVESMINYCFVDNYWPSVEYIVAGCEDNSGLVYDQSKSEIAYNNCVMERFHDHRAEGQRFFERQGRVSNSKYTFPNVIQLTLINTIEQKRILKEVNPNKLKVLKISKVAYDNFKPLDRFNFHGLESLFLTYSYSVTKTGCSISLNAPNLKRLEIYYGRSKYEGVVGFHEEYYPTDLFENISSFPKLKEISYSGPFLYSKNGPNKPFQVFENLMLPSLERLALTFTNPLYDLCSKSGYNPMRPKKFELRFSNCQFPNLLHLSVSAPKGDIMITDLPWELMSPNLYVLYLNGLLENDPISITINDGGYIRFVPNTHTPKLELESL